MFQPYRPDAPDRFAAEATRIREALSDLVLDIAHVGSSAVPGLPGKPTIDLLVGVRDLELPASLFERMAGLGYEYRGENSTPDRRYFREGARPPSSSGSVRRSRRPAEDHPDGRKRG